MKTIIAIASLALLAGCASVSELRSGTPYATLTTDKSPQAVAECIRDAWQNQRIGFEGNGAILQKSGDTLTIASPTGGIPMEVADISASGRINIYTQSSIDMGGRKDKRVAAATSCI